MRSRNEFVIGTRGSALALQQANYIASLVKGVRPHLEVRIEIIKTTGDKIRDVALSKVGGKGLFTKELEVALLEEQIDCCVHSMKDVPTVLPDGLELACMPLREDARDALIVKGHQARSIAELPSGARVGTGSLRRQAQLRALRGDLEIVELRGNLDTRLKRVEDGSLDAAILACAGINRMGWKERISAQLSLQEMLPAVGQGAIGVEIKSGDLFTASIVEQFNHQQTFRCISAERTIMRALDGGCQLPLGAFARILPGDTQMRIDACVCSLDGSRQVRAGIAGDQRKGEELALQLVDDLRSQGADEILAQLPAELNQASEKGDEKVVY